MPALQEVETLIATGSRFGEQVRSTICSQQLAGLVDQPQVPATRPSKHPALSPNCPSGPAWRRASSPAQQPRRSWPSVQPFETLGERRRCATEHGIRPESHRGDSNLQPAVCKTARESAASIVVAELTRARNTSLSPGLSNLPKSRPRRRVNMSVRSASQPRLATS